MQITVDHVIRFIERAAALIRDHAAELTELDTVIGDADHGTNLNRGFAAVVVKLDTFQESDIGAVLDMTGKTLLATVGGAAGPLYGTAFRRAGALLAGRSVIDGRDIAAALEVALQGIVERGGVQRGEKTMLDAIAPGVETFCNAMIQGKSLEEAAHHALIAVEEGMRATIPMQATKGRAAFLGPRSIGHQDPGATSAYFIARAMVGLDGDPPARESDAQNS
ncbi:MAG: dihydroxyacetone kinase subunit DhaL [Roseiflexus sp.]